MKEFRVTDGILIEDGQEYPEGETFKVSDDRAEELLLQPGLPIAEVGNAKPTRADLEETASKLGIANPGNKKSFPNIPALEAAIEETRKATAANGEGQSTTDSEETS